MAEFPQLPKEEQMSLHNCSLSHDKYWAVSLDGRILKTFYKDVMALPSRALAAAVAEEGAAALGKAPGRPWAVGASPSARCATSG